MTPEAERQERLLRILSGEDRRLAAAALRAALWALSPLYAIGISTYRGMYDGGFLSEQQVPVPVIAIGNLTVGGTGKTGMVRTVCEMLLGHGWQPAVLSYGYRAQSGSRPRLVSDGSDLLMGAGEAGDEAVMLSRELPGVPVVIGRRRIESARLALEVTDANILILDDGFQYWRLHKDAEIVLIDAAQPWGFGAVLPRGLLRELPTALRRASAVVLTHVSHADPAAMPALRRDVGRLAPGTPIFEGDYKAVGFRRAVDDTPIGSADILAGPVGVMSALGQPARFEASVAGTGARVDAIYRFPDHHCYSPGDLETVMSNARARGLSAVIISAKDAVKLELRSQVDPPIYILDSRLNVRPAGAFRVWMLARIGGRGAIEHGFQRLEPIMR